MERAVSAAVEGPRGVAADAGGERILDGEAATFPVLLVVKLNGLGGGFDSGKFDVAESRGAAKGNVSQCCLTFGLGRT